jgi:hypothetical protein
MNYDDLDVPDGSAENMGGTTQRVYLAPISTFLSIKTPSGSSVLGDLVKITTTHTFKSTFCWLKAYCTQDKGEVTFEPQGDTDGKSFKATGKFFYPGNKADTDGFVKQAKNDNWIVLFEKPDSATNGYVQIGSEMFPAKITPKFSTGTNSSGTQGYEFEVMATTDAKYTYTGAVTLTPAP